MVIAGMVWDAGMGQTIVHAWLKDVPTLKESHASAKLKEGEGIIKKPAKNSSSSASSVLVPEKDYGPPKAEASTYVPYQPPAIQAKELTLDDIYQIPDERPSGGVGQVVDPLKPPGSYAKPITKKTASKIHTSLNYFRGSTELSKYVYNKLHDSPISVSVPKNLFASKNYVEQIAELKDAVEESVLQNPYTGVVTSINVTASPGSAYVTAYLTYYLKVADARKYRAVRMEETVHEILDGTVFNTMTDLEKATKLYEYISSPTNVDVDVHSIETSKTNLNAQVVRVKSAAFFALVNRSAIAQGIAQGYKALCDEALIPCAVITGKLKRGDVPHTWCVIEVDGKWRTVDPTNPQLEICKQDGIFIDDITAQTLYEADGRSLVDSEIKNYVKYAK